MHLLQGTVVQYYNNSVDNVVGSRNRPQAHSPFGKTLSFSGIVIHELYLNSSNSISSDPFPMQELIELIELRLPHLRVLHILILGKIVEENLCTLKI